MFASTVATFQDNSVHGDDNFITRDLGSDGFLDAVMDGVTGHGGEEASSSVLEALAQASLHSPKDVVDLLEDINEEFYQVGGGRFLLTTISAALYLDEHLHVITAGDSPVFLVGPDSCQQLSGRFGGFLHVGVARAIGATLTLTNLTQLEVSIVPGSRLVLATDGLSDNMPTEQLADMVRRTSSPEIAAQEINQSVALLIDEGRFPEHLGGRFRPDDRTGIFRFFNDK